MRLGLMRDSRGKPSWTLTMALPAVVLITARWLVGGFDLTVRGLHLAVSAWSGADYAVAVGVWLGAFAQREWVEKKLAGNGEAGTAGQ